MNIRTYIRKATLTAALLMNQNNTGCIVFHCSNINTTQWKSLKRIVFQHCRLSSMQWQSRNQIFQFVYQPTFQKLLFTQKNKHKLSLNSNVFSSLKKKEKSNHYQEKNQKLFFNLFLNNAPIVCPKAKGHTKGQTIEQKCLPNCKTKSKRFGAFFFKGSLSKQKKTASEFFLKNNQSFFFKTIGVPTSFNSIQLKTVFAKEKNNTDFFTKYTMGSPWVPLKPFSKLQLLQLDSSQNTNFELCPKPFAFGQKLNAKKLHDIAVVTGGPLCVLFYKATVTDDGYNWWYPKTKNHWSQNKIQKELELKILLKQIQTSQSAVDHHLILLYFQSDQTCMNHLDLKCWLDLNPDHVLKQSFLCLHQSMRTICELYHLVVLYFIVCCVNLNC
jgi:hypothetical protein